MLLFSTDSMAIIKSMMIVAFDIQG